MNRKVRAAMAAAIEAEHERESIPDPPSKEELRSEWDAERALLDTPARPSFDYFVKGTP